MKLKKITKHLLATAFSVVAMGAPAAFALTIEFDGSPDESAFVYTDARLVSGNCGPSGPQCLALNNVEQTTITADGGGTFSAISFWFQLLGQGTNNTLIVDSSSGASVELDAATYGTNNGGQVFSLASLTGFSDITSLSFSSTDGGNVRIDDIALDVAPIPLPASGLLLIGPLALMLGAARRRRKA